MLTDVRHFVKLVRSQASSVDCFTAGSTLCERRVISDLIGRLVRPNSKWQMTSPVGGISHLFGFSLVPTFGVRPDVALLDACGSDEEHPDHGERIDHSRNQEEQ